MLFDNLIKVHVIVFFLWDLFNHLLLLLYHLFFLLNFLSFFGLLFSMGCFEHGCARLELGICVKVAFGLESVSFDLLDSSVFELLSAGLPVRSEYEFEDLVLGK